MKKRSMRKIKIRTNKGVVDEEGNPEPPAYANAYQINFRRTKYGKAGITYIVYGDYNKARKFARRMEMIG